MMIDDDNNNDDNNNDDNNDDDVHLCVGEAANLPLLFFLPHLAHRLAPVDCDHC